MPFYALLKKHGYTFRQHLEEEGWGWFIPTVVDLNTAQASALADDGIKGLKASLDGKRYRPPDGLFTFPSFDIEQALPRNPDLVLACNGRPAASVVVPQKNAELTALARDWTDMIEKRHGVRLPILDDENAGTALLDTQSLVVFGGSHQNRLALALALRYRTLFVDAAVPGDDGWVVTTHCGLHKSGHNVAQIAAPPEHRTTVLELLAGNLHAANYMLVWKNMHRIKPGAFMAGHFPDWDSFAESLPERILQLKGSGVKAPQEIRELSELLAQGLNSGGIEKSIYNVAPVDIANDCALYYMLSAEPRALLLFRELLFRLTDYYLKKDGGACYPADLDFRLGLLVLNFSRLEHAPAFDDEDRLLLANMLLSCTRTVYEHSYKIWPADRVGKSRFNHQTFPALSLIYAAEYFSRFSLPYVSAWRAYAEEIFSGDLWRRSKQCENSRSYEPFVFDHAALYAFFTGRNLNLFKKGCFEIAAERQIAATDNFLRPVDYGDTGIGMKAVNSLSARFLAIENDGLFRWFAKEGFARNPAYVQESFLDCPGIRIFGSESPPPAGEWERIPLDPAFLKEKAPGFPHRLAFDKLAFRTGWDDEDQYLLLEGVGGEVAHSHRDANSIVRLNHLGRHWIVSNGYGRKTGVTNVSKSYRSRERGPGDHNMLVLQRSGEIVLALPMGVLLQHGRKGQALYSTSALLDYGGVNWFRTLIIMAGQYVLAIDRINIMRAGLEKAYVEWNCLGKAAAQENGFRLEQKGVFMDVTSPSGWQGELKVADQSACWKQVLEDGSYPYAAFPLTKLVFHLPDIAEGKNNCLATLLAATRSGAQFMVSETESGRLVVEGPHGMNLKIKDKDLTLKVDDKHCEVRFSVVPEI